jgi:two-component system, LuxR family, sensor kinase FixL
VLVYTTDLELHYTWIHGPIHGIEVTGLIGKRDEDVLPFDDVAELVDFKKQVLESEQSDSKEIKVLINKQRKVYDMYAEPQYDAMGALIGLIVAGIDITERKQIENQLRYQALIVENVHDAVIAVTPNGDITSWNKEAEQLWGWKASEVLGKRVTEVITLETTSEAFQSAQKQWEEGSLSVEGILQHDRSHNEFYIDATIAPLKDASGATRGFVAAVRDVTGRVKAEAALQTYTEKLAQSNQELENFAFIASHDLQEPLRKVRLFSNYLVESAASKLDEEELEFLHRMDRAAARMSALIENLLTYSRLDSQERKFKLVPLSEAAAEALSNLEVRIERSRATIEVGDLPVIQADPLQMRQLLQNLIGNAIKFCPPGVAPRVKVSSRLLPATREQGERVEISVQDWGIGFDESMLDHLFKPFTRLVGRSQYEGSGIGLAICRKICERHGGSVTASSQKGKGSTFIVTLPVTQAQSIHTEG